MKAIGHESLSYDVIVSTVAPPLEVFGVQALRDTMTTFREVLSAHAERINRLNVYPVPDGDTGTNMARTLDAVVAEMEGAPDELVATCDAISHGSLMGARGNSGVILSQIMRGIASTLKGAGGVNGATVAEALGVATDAAYKAVLTPVEGTILTVVRESADAARDAAGDGASLAGVVRAARDASRAALDRTPELLPVLKEAGVVDAGGAGYLLLLDAALHVIDGEPLPEAPEGLIAAPVAGPTQKHATGDTRYEVMFFCDLDDERIEDLKQSWGAIGDSIVVVGGDGIWNCHVHTNDIGAAVEAALDVEGRPRQIRVTDLFEEVAAEHAVREAELIAGAGEPELPAVTSAVVAVSSGDGISELFRELGVQGIVRGGQTMNPSTAELLDAVESVNAGQVVVLPGNKNIIPVAEQLDALTTKTVRVVPTRSMPEGLAALMAYDPEADAPTNTTAMRASAEIASGEITRAVRASQTDAGPVAEGDWMGIVRGDGIVAVSADLVEAGTTLLERLISDRSELVTVLTGADADDATTAAITEWVAEHHPAVDVEVHDGGQPLYPYLFGVE
jgi:DAK2 domain fusion protein YloV